jgi:hypothetical protein
VPNESLHEAGEETLAAVVSARARRATDGQLVVAVAVGLTSAVAIGIFWPGWWRLALPLVSLAAFGVWGIADRSAGRPAGASQRVLAALRWTAVVIGTLSIVTFVLALTATAIGTWNL